MSVRLHIIESPGKSFRWTFKHDPGAMWRNPDLDPDGREAWVIVLPNKAGVWWTTELAKGTERMWDVTGEPPNITVSPSINAGDGPGPGNWHGWIKDGEMTP